MSNFKPNSTSICFLFSMEIRIWFSNFFIKEWALIFFFYFLREAPKTQYMFAYNSYGVTLTEVTLDLLTGQHCIDRVDMLFDCGERYEYRQYTCTLYVSCILKQKTLICSPCTCTEKNTFLQLERKTVHTGNRLGSRENFRTIHI